MGTKFDNRRLVPIMQAPKEFSDWLPRRRKGQVPSGSWLARMRKYGAHGVRLKTTHVGFSECVTEHDLRQFFEALSAARRGVTPSINTDHTTDHEQAERELVAAGM